MVRQLRQRLGIASIRDFAETNGYCHGTLTRFETEKRPPWSSKQKLEQFAFKLGLHPTSDAYRELVARGLLDSGRLPDWGCENPLQGERFVELLELLRRRPSLVCEVVDFLRERLGADPPELPDVDPYARVAIRDQCRRTA